MRVSRLKLDDLHDYPSVDWDGSKAEAKWMRTILPRTMSRFTKKYAGTHFQNLPPELLQAIAIQCNVAALPGIGGFRATHALGKYRTLCRATSQAGTAALLHIARRRGRVPQKLRIPDRDRTLEQTLALFKGTGLGALVKEVHFDVMPTYPRTNQKSLMIEYFTDKGLPRPRATKRAADVLKELETATRHQEQFFASLKTHVGFKTLTDILDCMPNLEELEVQMLNF